MKYSNMNFDDLWPKVNEPLVYLGPDREGYLTHGKEYKFKGILFISCADLIKVKDDSGFNCLAELCLFSLCENL